MNRLKHKVLSAILGLSSGLAGVFSINRCPGGGACSSCFGCAGVGAGVIMMILVSRFKRKIVR